MLCAAAKIAIVELNYYVPIRITARPLKCSQLRPTLNGGIICGNQAAFQLFLFLQIAQCLGTCG